MADWKEILGVMADYLWNAGNEWQNFDHMARQLRGDPSDGALLAAIADAFPSVFVVHNECRVKLTLEAVERIRQREAEAEAEQEANPPDSQFTSEDLLGVAVRAVRRYAAQLDPISLPIDATDSGVRVLDRYLHALTICDSDDDLRLSDDTPVELKRADGYRNRGYVAGLSRDQSKIYVALDHQVFPADLPATLEVHRNRTWIDIATRLDALHELPPFASDLFASNDAPALANQDSWLLYLDLYHLPTPWTRLLWGPPGGGKTYCLAALSEALLRSPTERVLLVAPSNVAADVATLQVVRTLESRQNGDLISNRKLLRYGYPRDERILSRPELLGSPELEQLARRIDEGFQRIKRLVGEHAPEAQVAGAKAEVRQLSEERKRRTAEHVSSARFVATTLAALAGPKCPILEAGPWQTVILDEASMVSGAALAFAGSFAAKRFLAVGDPRQLGPVFEWRSGTPPIEVLLWLDRDPYQIAGLSRGTGLATEINTEDSRVARITNQWRCHPDLWHLVQPLYPGVGCKADMQRVQPLAALSPVTGSAFVVLDLGLGGRIPSRYDLEGIGADDAAFSYESACRKIGRSWQNPPTAMIAIDVAREIRAQAPLASVAIIAPYRGQVRLIRRWLDEERRADTRLRGIDVGTVHAFQGSESDVVIFDVVDGPPRANVGTLLRGDCGVRLVNVAASRARGKLILLIHSEWFFDVTAREQAPLLWDIVKAGAHIVGVAEPRNDGPGNQVESPIERIILDEMLRRRAELPSFELQYPITNERDRIVSRADFAFPDERLCVFCDGARYHLVRDQWQRDLRQRRELARLGWKYLVFTGSEIITDSGRSCVQEIMENLRLTQAGGARNVTTG